MLRVHGLRKSFGDVTAVDALDLELETGETLGLLGPNGAGKTTAIHCIVGALEPDAGTIEIGDLGAPTGRAARAAIGFAPQELAIYAELTAAENLALFGRLHGLSGHGLDARVDAALELAGLTDRRADRAGTFSGGMKRRLNLACALVHEPRLVLLDEPTAGVDPQSRNHLFECIEALAGGGTTILYTTHYMEEAERLCDRIAIVDRGRVHALDTLDGLIGRLGRACTVELELEGEAPDALELPAPVEDGHHLRFESTTPVHDLDRLTSAGLRFRELHIHRPDLESVFLDLTGRSLRD